MIKRTLIAALLLAGAAQAQSGPGASVGNAAGLWGVTSAGAPCLVAPQGATGAVTCSLPTSGGGGGGATSGPIVSFRQTSTASAVALPSNALTNGIVCTAASTNTGTAYLGGSGETTSTGYPLAAGYSISYGVNNSNLVYLIGSDTSKVIACTGN